MKLYAIKTGAKLCYEVTNNTTLSSWKCSTYFGFAGDSLHSNCITVTWDT